MPTFEPHQLTLSDSFLDRYRGKQPQWGFGGLGWIVYLRTYSREKPDGTLEQWWETCRRVTEGNFRIEAQRLAELYKLDHIRLGHLQLEMTQFYHMMYNLHETPPGRGLWMSGTPYAEEVGDAENNCWLVSMRPQPYHKGEAPAVSFAPVFTFDQAMKGGGVGVNVQRQNVELIPAVRHKLELTLICRADHPDAKELQALGVHLYTGEPLLAGSITDYFLVPDKREGWRDALRQVIDAHYEGDWAGGSTLTVDLSGVRERGAKIVRFGGVASGPGPLADMLGKVNTILNKRVYDYVTPTEWGDVIQNIGCCVVAGNVRRTALILIGDNKDKEFVESKNYSLPQNLVGSQWRWASNNSVDVSSDTKREVLQELARNIYYNGEPGYVNIDLARRAGRIVDGVLDGPYALIDPEVEGFNPCGEITLPNGSPCNLFEINLPGIERAIQAGIETDETYDLAVQLAVRYAYRITFRPYEWEVTRDVVSRHRRLGVGLTGITDWVLLKFGERAILGFDSDGDPIFNEQVTKFLDRLYSVAVRANNEQAMDLEASISIKLTTIKPSGTVSLLMGVSPGQHFHWAAHMIRRVTIPAAHPLSEALIECGYPYEPKHRGFDADGNVVWDFNTYIFQFPVVAPTAHLQGFQSAGDVALREQAALQALLATHWSDNAVSATLSFHKAQPTPVYFSDGRQLADKFGKPVLQVNPNDEVQVVEEITDILDRYKGIIKSTSLLPYDTGTYPQMPYEAITKAEYDRRQAQITAKPWELLQGDITVADQGELDTSSECVGGSCPLR